MSHKDEIKSMLLELDDNFLESKGGGWSFLNMCTTKDGTLWTSFHRKMEQLCMLAIGTKTGKWVIEDRSIWYALPGGVPYFVIIEEKT
jgi:hypothetical protein